MAVPVGLNVWSKLTEDTFPYLDRTAHPFDSLWFPDHVQYGARKSRRGGACSRMPLARYPDKLCGHTERRSPHRSLRGRPVLPTSLDTIPSG